MIVIRTAFLAPQGVLDRPGEQFVCDLIRLCALPRDRVEHVRVLAGPRGFDVVWFLLSDNESAARHAAESISRRVIAATPLLANWGVV